MSDVNFEYYFLRLSGEHKELISEPLVWKGGLPFYANRGAFRTVEEAAAEAQRLHRKNVRIEIIHQKGDEESVVRRVRDILPPNMHENLYPPPEPTLPQKVWKPFGKVLKAIGIGFWVSVAAAMANPGEIVIFAAFLIGTAIAFLSIWDSKES